MIGKIIALVVFVSLVFEVSAVPVDDPLRNLSKRSIFIFPGTKWCGAGNDAENDNDFGPAVETDHCCFDHDHCPNSISSWTSGYGLFNKYLSTISECACDRKFSQCLKKANEDVAAAIHNLYFNTLAIPCFDLVDGQARWSEI